MYITNIIYVYNFKKMRIYITIGIKSSESKYESAVFKISNMK